MDITFMGAALPLTKTLVHRDGHTAVAPYPHVVKLTSYQESVSSLNEFESALRTHATQGHCLFNGHLKQPLRAESRAGKTLKGAPRHWVVFDFDKIEARNHKEVVAKYLPRECQQVSYLVQHSASMWLPDATAWSGHIFMLLAEPSDEKQLRQYIEHINFTLPALKASLSLTHSGIALHWPLDRSAAYDSKLIFIAPPRCHGFTPAYNADTAIALITKKQP